MKKTESRFYEMWKEIEDNFDFRKVYEAMKCLNIFWVFENNLTGIPTVHTIKENCRERLHQIYFDDEHSEIGTGGFIHGYDEEHDSLYLRYEIESWDS